MRNRPFPPQKRIKKDRRVADQFDNMNNTERQQIGRFVSDINDAHYEHFLECINEAPKLKHLESFSAKMMHLIGLKQQNQYQRFLNQVL